VIGSFRDARILLSLPSAVTLPSPSLPSSQTRGSSQTSNVTGNAGNPEFARLTTRDGSHPMVRECPFSNSQNRIRPAGERASRKAENDKPIVFSGRPRPALAEDLHHESGRVAEEFWRRVNLSSTAPGNSIPASARRKALDQIDCCDSLFGNSIVYLHVPPLMD